MSFKKLKNKKPTSVLIYTLGCKVNQAESEEIKKLLQSNDFVITEDSKSADIFIINSCSVTSIADRKTRQFARKGKRLNENAKVIVIGCSVNINKDDLEKIEEIDYLISSDNKDGVGEEILEIIEKSKRNYSNSDAKQNEGTEKKEKRKQKVFLKIQDGCNMFCSYCVIPYARSKLRSRSIRDVLTSVNNFLDEGYREIVLTGINIGLYFDKESGEGLLNLLEEINKIDRDFKVTLGSLEGNIFNENLIKKILALKKVNSNFHISIQSCSDKILKLMNRKYKSADIKKVIETIRKIRKDYFISADIIVGFPSESNDDFLKTYEFLKDVKLNHIHIFRYSKRPQTKASTMENQVPEEVKKERAKKLDELN